MTNSKRTTEEKQGIVNIHGKDYVTVARRVQDAHSDNGFEELFTEILSQEPVIIRATVTIKGKKYTGISSVNSQTGKMIEKQNPYEVAETSAVGRALGFAGFGIIEGIASADEVVHAVNVGSSAGSGRADVAENVEAHTSRQVADFTCEICGDAISMKVADYSRREFGNQLCFDHQSEARKEQRS